MVERDRSARDAEARPDGADRRISPGASSADRCGHLLRYTPDPSRIGETAPATDLVSSRANRSLQRRSGVGGRTALPFGDAVRVGNQSRPDATGTVRRSRADERSARAEREVRRARCGTFRSARPGADASHRGHARRWSAMDLRAERVGGRSRRPSRDVVSHGPKSAPSS
jgi:hypothetical protein